MTRMNGPTFKSHDPDDRALADVTRLQHGKVGPAHHNSLTIELYYLGIPRKDLPLL